MHPPSQKSTKGRGATHNPANRFETIHLEPDPEWDPAHNLKVKSPIVASKQLLI